MPLQDGGAAGMRGLGAFISRVVDLDLCLARFDLVLGPVFALRQLLGDAQAALGIGKLACGLRGQGFGLFVGRFLEFGIKLKQQIASLHLGAAVEMHRADEPLKRR